MQIYDIIHADTGDCVGCALWMLYGVYLNSFQMVLFNGITLLLNGIILHLIVFSKGNKK